MRIATLARTSVEWSEDFIVIDGETLAATALAEIERSSSRWVVIRRRERMFVYALRRDEILATMSATRAGGADLESIWLVAALHLHEHHSSTLTTSRKKPPPIDLSWRPGPLADYASVHRYVHRTAQGEILAVGVPVTTRRRALRGGKAIKAGPDITSAVAGDLVRYPPLPVTPEAPADAADGDEGLTPVRHPSIEADAPPAAGQPITFTVDLKRQKVAHTAGRVALGPLAADWSTLKLGVHLESEQIDFEGNGDGTAEIRRNKDGLPAIIKGRVHADLGAGDRIEVIANFYEGTRFCGMAVRVFNAAGAAEATTGTVGVERHAAAPDLCVDIAKLKDRAGRLLWNVRTAERFDGLPPELSAEIDLEHDTAAEAAALFKEFAKLEPGKHRKRIEAFGSKLWQRAPQMFRDVYWALWDHYQRPLTIQFIVDEPYLPWELMRPVRADESEIHPPLALKHPTARWIKRWDGYMRNRLPHGRLYTIAPKYSSIAVALPRAEAEAQALVDKFEATKVLGTHAAVNALFEHPPSGDGVALLHFAGHGKFSAQGADSSFIKLEGTDVLAAAEVDRPEVQLGRTCRTLVFFNACEVGAAGSVLGEVGGWANAFLARRFGGFIAPLWSVEDDDASVVSSDLIERIYKKHQPIGEALRAIREQYGDRSPTFFSYLYYGDVTARLDGG